MDQALGGVGVLWSLGIVLLLLVIAVLWIALPFAVFGTKDLLRQLLQEQKRTNTLLAEQRDRWEARELREKAARNQVPPAL